MPEFGRYFLYAHPMAYRLSQYILHQGYLTSLDTSGLKSSAISTIQEKLDAKMLALLPSVVIIASGIVSILWQNPLLNLIAMRL
jgi:hypothetical protein